jgi:hypothetical protein
MFVEKVQSLSRIIIVKKNEVKLTENSQVQDFS